MLKNPQASILISSYNKGNYLEQCIKSCLSQTQKNIEVVYEICEILDRVVDKKLNYFESHKELIEFVEDRPGHDQRYAIDASKIRKELGWAPNESFQTGLNLTVKWYLENRNWWENILQSNHNSKG